MSLEAKKKLMDFVARREHSEKELRQKLSLHFEPDIVESTLLWAREKKWLAETELENAQKQVRAKWAPHVFDGLDSNETRKLRAKILRFLTNRGFESDTIHFILKNDFKISMPNEENIYDDEF